MFKNEKGVTFRDLLPRLAALHARHEFEQGHREAGVEDALAILALARHVGTDPHGNHPATVDSPRLRRTRSDARAVSSRISATSVGFRRA